MDLYQARQLLLLRAHERGHPAPATWAPADQAWASDEALRQVGEQASAEQWLLRRAELGSERLLQRDPALAPLLQPARHTAWWMAGLTGVAAIAGLASDMVGPAQRINLLAPPLLLVIGWNLVVYLGLLLATLAPARSRDDRPGAIAEGLGPLRRALVGVTRRLGPRRPASPEARRFVEDWNEATTPLQAARLVTTLHLAAAAVAAGALAALYLRGLGFEYRAGWDSTFLGVETVHAWLSGLLGPAATLSGIALPDQAELEALRFSRGPGENAARWIHLYALTTAGLVLLPRLALAAWAAWQGRRLARGSLLPPDDPWRQRLLQQHARFQRGSDLRVQVLPYSLRLDPASLPALATALAHELGPGLAVEALPGLPLGGEDELDLHWPLPAPGAPTPAVVVLLFNLAATPERETHGACLRQVQARCAALTPAPRCVVAIDEAAFRQRLADTDLASRLAQRRAAWQRLLDDVGPAGQAPVFVDLGRAKETAA